MSANGDSGPGRREVAYRLFAAEFDDASLSYSESDEERAPNYVVTPTGLRVNRLFAVGVLTEVETINEDTLRGRIVDPTGAFVTYAGQYQPPAQAFLDQTMPPAFVAITGKARTFEPEDSDRVFTSVRPESLSEVDADTRDRWVVSAAEATLHRIAVFAAALDSSLRGAELHEALSEAGVRDSLAAGIPRAIDHYGTTTAYLDALREVAVDALELIADEREEVRPLDIAPGEDGDTALGELPTVDLELGDEALSTPASTESTEPSEPVSTDATDSPDSTVSPGTTEADLTTEAESTPEPSTESAPDSVPETDAEPSTESTATDVESTEPDAEAANGAVESDVETETEPTEDDSIDEEFEESGMYQLDDEEREEIESDFGTEFSSGNDVDPAGEADIDVPDVDELAEKAQVEQAPTEEPATTEPSAEDTASPTDDEHAETPTETTETLGEFEDVSGSETTDAETEPPTSAGDSPTEIPEDETPATDETSLEDETPADEPADEPPAADDIDLEETVVETMGEIDDGDGVDRQDLVTTVVDSTGADAAAVEDAIDDALMGGRCYEPTEGLLKAI
jgi:hypothetical protein